MMKQGAYILMITVGLFCCGKKQNQIERLSKVELPRGTKTVEIIDNGQYEIDGKFMVPENKISEFSGTNHFEPLEKVPSYKEQFIKLLSLENTPQIENKEEYLWLEDCNAGNHWRFLLDEHTGELWSSVEYTDRAGKAPPCDK